MKKSGICHIIWDWNGTLLDDASACALAVDALMRKRGMPGETLAGYRSRIRFPVKLYYQAAGFRLHEEDYSALCDEFGEAYEEASALPVKKGSVAHSIIHEDVEAVLHASSACGVSHSIVSASEAETLQRQVAEWNLSDYFIALVGRDDNTGGTKDHLVADWVARCGIRRERILYVGDTEHDAEAAAAAGIRCALVADGHVDESRLHPCRLPVYADRTSLWADVSGMTAERVYYELTVRTTVGKIRVLTDALGVVRVELPGMEPWTPASGLRIVPANTRCLKAGEALKEWFSGRNMLPHAPLSLSGTPFQRKVWEEVCRIPRGEVLSYGALAMRIGKPGAARAVAGALKSNPVPLFIPCHRVVGSDGTPIGFMGIRHHPLQQRLLDAEALI